MNYYESTEQKNELADQRRNAYEEKRQARINRMRERAAQARKESDAAHDQAHRMASVIPFGQPILVGHHSEKRDRRYRGRIQNKFEKAFEEQKKAEHYAQRAAAAEDNTAISSDDPEAVLKLREKLADLEKLQEMMKAANKIVKRKGTQSEKVAELEALGIKDPARIFTPDFAGRIGFPDYAITNNGAEIRRCKKRIEQLLEASKREYRKREFGDICLVEDPDENRVKIFFPSKPSEQIRAMLKERGFHWSSYNGAWQRQLNSAGIYAAEYVISKINEK